MTNSLTGGVTYQVNPAGSDITSFNPTSDQLEFGQISVHGLILGTLSDGTAAIVNPWADPVQSQSLQGLSWNDLDLDNFGIVGNEHLRQDIGGVLSWEQGIGPRQSDTVYVRSHQFGVQEVINDFDPQTQKLNFLYTGTRERLSVIDTEQGLLIRFEPTDQSILLAGVQRTDLIGANLEFHHDQVMEDNLEVPFGFNADEVALVSRTGLLTPQAPAGESTDGDQVRAGLMVNPESMVMAIDPAHSMHDHSMHEHVMAGDEMSANGMAPMVMAPEIVPDVSGTAGLEASVAGTLYSGGMSGTLTLANTSDVAQTDWSISVLTNQPDFQSWSAESSVTDLGSGIYQVTLTPPAWGLEIPAGGSVGLAFNAGSVGLPDSGELTNELFFVGSNPVAAVVESPAVIETPEVVETPAVESSPVSDPPSGAVMAQGLSVSATINDGWSGTFAGQITVSNLGDTSAGTDWGVSFIADAPFTTASNFEVESVLRSDGRYNVSLAPKAWSAPLDAGASQTSYYQAAGDARDPGEVFDFGESSANTTVSQPSSDAAVVETPPVVESPAVIETPEVVETPAVESSPVSDPPSGAVMAQGLSVSATINDGWSGTFAGQITVSNLGDTSAGTDWGVSFIADAPFTTASNFEVESVLRSDGRYNVSLAPKAWSAPLDAGASQTSYYQAAGDARDPGEVFDFGESSANTTVSQPSSDAAVVETPPVMEIPAVVDASPGASTDPVDMPVQASVDVVEAGDVAVDVHSPNRGSDKRIVTYFEEWGVYERDINLSDVNGQAMTHLNYSFFDVKADGSVELFDSYAAQEKRFDAADQVRRSFTKAEYQAVDPALIAAYNSDRYTISESADTFTVTSVPVGWNDAGPQDAGNFEQLSRFKELNPSVNLGFALGGWTLSDEFSTAFASQAGRDQFTRDVVDIFKTYDFFSVVDFDWEYPGGGGDSGNASSSNDGANFALVLEQLRGELDALEVQTGGSFEVSIATAGGSEKLANLNLAGIDAYVDFYNVMTYDFHGGWENQTGHQAAMTGDANNYDVTTSVSVFEAAGVELNKVVLGAPAYTRAWGGVADGGTFGYQQSGSGVEAQGSFEAGTYDYKDIVTDVITGQTDLYWDDNSKAAYVYNGDEWSSIETTATIAGKAAYVQEKGLGGMMFWALSNDAKGDLSLVDAADNILRQGASYEEAVESAPEFDFILGGNGEFSMSDFTVLA